MVPVTRGLGRPGAVLGTTLLRSLASRGHHGVVLTFRTPTKALCSSRHSVSVVCKTGKKKPKTTKSAGSVKRGGNFPPESLDAGVTLANNITSFGASSLESVGARPQLRALQRCRTLVLDCSYRPIDVVNWQRAVCLDIFDKADVLEYYEEKVRASRESYPVPAVVRVRFFLKPSQKGLPCVRRYILIRDDYTCQYCGCRRNLSMDHIHPVSRGGDWSWENLVTCCTACNGKKGSKTLAELGWKLRKQPRAPSPFEMEVVQNMTASDIKSPPPEWTVYLQAGQLEKMLPAR